MTQVIIQDVTPRTQIISAADQTVFNTIWTADVATDIDVYARPQGVEANDVTQIVNPNLYDVTFIGSSRTVRITFLTGQAENEIITIVRNTPPERLNLYINTNFTPSMLNQDFGLLTLIDQQNQMYDTRINPGYNVSEIIDPIIDRILPILDADQTWVMNSTRTKIIPFNLPTGGGLAPGDATYLLQTPDTGLPNAQSMSELFSGFVVSTNATGVQLTRILTDVESQTFITNADGIDGNPTIGLSDNAMLPGTEGIGIPIGTTAQRPLTPVGTNLRFNTDLELIEYWDGVMWVQQSELDGVLSVQGTENQVLVNGTFDMQIEGNVILTLPQDIAPTSSPTFATVITASVDSSSSNPIIGFSSTPDDVNYFSASSATTTNPPILSVMGADPDIDLQLASKGQGSILAFTEHTDRPLILYNGAGGQHVTVLEMASTAAIRVVTFQDSDGTVAYLSDIVDNGKVNTGIENDLAFYASTGDEVSGLPSAPSSVLITDENGVPSMSGALLNGQIIIGSTGDSPVKATIGAGPGISILNSPGGITISSSGGGTGFIEVTGTSQAMLPDGGYVANNVGLVTLTLPAIAPFGTTISIVGKGAGGWRIAQNAGQTINIGNSVTSTGITGSVSSTDRTDAIYLLCITANTVWTTRVAPQSSGLTIV